jgi:hypothetical protein
MHDHGGRRTPARPPRRRWRRSHLAALAAVLALTLAVAACGGGGKSDGVASLSGSNKPTATTSASSSKDFKQAALAFARCMRQHGIDMPDPQFTGNGRITQELKSGPGGKGPDDPKFKAAQQACQKYMPNGGTIKKPSPQEQQQMLAFARCMRQHGIDVPDPGPNGGITINGGNGSKGPNPDDPKFKAAQQACQKLLPNAGKGQGGLSTSGGGK